MFVIPVKNDKLRFYFLVVVLITSALIANVLSSLSFTVT